MKQISGSGWRSAKPRPFVAVFCTVLIRGLLMTAFPATALADWQALAMTDKPVATADGLMLPDGDAALTITVINDAVIRVRYTDKRKLALDRSFAVLPQKPYQGKLSVDVGSNTSTVRTPALRVVVQHQPLRLEFFDRDGRSLDQDDAEQGMARSAEVFRVAKRLRDDEQVYGFGEKTGRLNKRGMGLGGYHYTMWNSDTYGYDMSIDPLYVSVPFYLVLREGRAHGIFLDNSFRSSFDVGRDSRNRLSFGAEGGELNYYFIHGPHPKDVVARYTELTGRMPMPPRWALGFHQSRWSYYPEARVRLLADTFRSKRIPADTLWLDIDYLDGFKPFAWNREYFPDPAGMIRDLRQQGFRVVTIVDAHPKKEVGYRPYDEGIAGNHFVKNPDGSVFEGPVWPANAKKNPGNSVFPDFTRAATRAWWGGLHQELLEQGVAGIWNDMNEPAVWIPPSNTMPLNVRHENDGAPTDQREIHNVYGLLHTRATFEGLQRLRPELRPFVLTRASFAGGQRYAAVWPGDNTADWSSLRQSLPMLMGMGLSGFSFVGTDIGGFAGYPSPELFTRWLQAAVFAPFMRAHTEQATPDQEPWSFGAQHEAINRRAIELRYELLPQIYKVMEEASRTGVPALRPLFLEFPTDPQTWSRDDQFLFGADLLVAPVIVEGVSQRDIYLPAGDWFDYWTGALQRGGQTIRVPVSLSSLPIYVRAGAFVFHQPVVQHTGEMAGLPLQVDIYPASDSHGEWYEDDGESLAYQRGEQSRRTFRQQRDRHATTLTISASEGRYRPAARQLDLLLVGEHAGKRVLVNGKLLAQQAPNAPASVGPHWTQTERGLLIRLADDAKAMQISIQH
ncbi:glycoside hydrolase family 31 protein [Permianibacter sp. IMCC34836]|uniref:glycoside hydrolase family 31 protein n=1 Tax=Permianibacter fluminis TaxID=2738515 RepID=UPI001556BD65|nr:glycoside hydrolase family 31 protein [Permianibacter fluminis]NQD37506.1 glycoside hydrolase family 31 protein [Permianibacter fluminis]